MNTSKLTITQHAIDQFAFRYLNVKECNRHSNSYYEKLIYGYLKEAVKIEIPPFIKMEKALKYDRRKNEIFLLHRAEKLLFIIVDKTVITSYYPYNDSQRFQRRAVPWNSQVRRKRKKKRK